MFAVCFAAPFDSAVGLVSNILLALESKFSFSARLLLTRGGEGVQNVPATCVSGCGFIITAISKKKKTERKGTERKRTKRNGKETLRHSTFFVVFEKFHA